ncbi:MAG: (5-formylfuran-3-yl)methyl phosphate synthase [Nitrospirota bacterium]
MQRLLVSVRGPREALAAIKGGAHIADVEYPASALGTPYPLNIMTVRNRLNKAGYKMWASLEKNRFRRLQSLSKWKYCPEGTNL